MINLESAKRMSKACQAKAKEMGIPMTIAIVDKGANLILCERMDGSIIAGIRISQDKAYTSAATGFGTHEIAGISQPGQVAYGLQNADGGRIMIFAGGLPLKMGGELIGGIGVSGGLANQDQEVAQAGVDAFEDK
ncbi:MAG: hypothetical protein A3B96_00240 [Candidatus Spechtbacteria bacterium RIFCSPHIGHO2_02_FULL_43_15b]|uniref:Uncharacterized protein n=1 Tax=Candidatus Spechtbacteria bacterium RIFCSPHIGHO2_01_FULL_43_30 TaxID=1802158 RepID=A0A1G2H7E3_9BACT|nr:MAG: hypothetical protein A2827_02575 [Candidatus Spechtbacteria bacterium RIFCSPHIGHO2_01_FULL_43_30]OGZ58711.1 MAG: hypothetical protein A3B96_00240 [Candidatus Spechtbacteria bacterium RIFCSPHIGHO2_02_FULL_43_15b]